MELVRKVSLCSSRILTINRCYHHSSYSIRTHTCGELRSSHVGDHVTLCGWMRKPRKFESFVFIPLADATGSTQLVLENKEILDAINNVNIESIIKVKGVVTERPHVNINKDMITGSIEVQVDSLEILNKSDDLPFLPYSKAAANLSEELMLKERHIDIRRPVVQNVLRFRSQVSHIVRQYLNNNGFIEVETPTLFKPTPEGAKEFLVPTQECGKFFSLTQSPQQFKQLLMVGGIDRYFQFARCYRDERSRSDRQPEFTQIDLEMSFVTQDSLMRLIEDIMNEVITGSLPNVAPPSRPFPVMSYRQAINEYGSDKPDTRYDMKFHNLTAQWREECINKNNSLTSLMDLEVVVFRIPQWKQMTGKFRTSKWKDVWRPLHDSAVQPATILSHSGNNSKIIIKADDSSRVGKLSNIITEHPSEISNVLSGVTSHMTDGCGQDGFVIAVYDKSDKDKVLHSLGRLRTNIANELCKSDLMTLSLDHFECLWITDFPLFSIETDDNGDQVVKSTHHPFTAPVQEHLHKLYTATSIEDLTKITAQHYDLVVNGWELGGGSIRIHNADIQEYVLTEILKTGTDKFSHLLKGLRSGCPPHGGIALGFDRMIAVLSGMSGLRDVIAFPKSTNGRDLLMESPAYVSQEELNDYNIQLITD